MTTGQTTRISIPIPGLFYAKAFYLCFFSAMGGYIYFLSLYYKQIGLGDRQIGLLAGLPPLITLIGAPLWGQAYDRLRGGRWLLPAICLATLPLVFLISQARGFVPIVLLTLMYAFLATPIAPIGDHLTLTLLGGQRHRYGEQRIWGAVGFGLAAWAAGALSERYGLWSIFMVYIGGMALCALTAFNLGGVSTSTPAGPGGAGLGILMRQRVWQLFLLSILLTGASMSAFNSFYPLFLQHLGAGEALFGFSITIATLSELPIFFFSARLLRRWGAGGVLVLALTVYILRWLLYSVAGTPELALAGQALHGLSFSALWVAGVSYAERQAPPGLGATAQGMFNGTLYGVSAIGSVAGGLIYAAAGPVVLFRVAALTTTLALFVFLGARAAERRRAP
jgi:MFS transporter, PPP family, 3-phenylpropionic acid transporter